MKCFIDEALRFWGYCARHCIIDNTNLAVFTGTGSSAIMCPEMVSFADNYGFIWKAHAVGHANRKAGKERNFYTVATNFLPGRTFTSLEDLNRQAIEWATVRYAKRPLSKTKLIPCELFETEKNSLIKLPGFISAPYLPHRRLVDQYGYCSFDGNYYWIPETIASRAVTVLQYASHLRIMDGTREVQRYDLPAEGVNRHAFERRRASRLKAAGIPEKLVMETFPFDQQSQLRKKTVLELYDTLRYITESQVLLFIGPTGCGKTGLATS